MPLRVERDDVVSTVCIIFSIVISLMIFLYSIHHLEEKSFTFQVSCSVDIEIAYAVVSESYVMER